MRSTQMAEAVEDLVAGAGGLDERILALVALREQTDALLVEAVGQFDAAEGYKDDGAFSFATWLRARADITASDAGQLARLARSLRSMPATAAALAEGALSIAKAAMLARVVNERTRDRFAHDEQVLVDAVQALDLDNAKVLLAQWKRLADSDGPDPCDPTRNRASLTTGWEGRFHLDGDFDPASGAVISSVLQAILDRLHQDGRFNDLAPEQNTATHRTAVALLEMAERASGRNPDQPAVHPEIVVLVPHNEDPDDPLAEEPEILGVGRVDWDTVLRLALTGSVAALHLDDEGDPVKLSLPHLVTGSLEDAVHCAVADEHPGQPLDLSRTRRLATRAQRIAITYRDRGCVVPGCHRPTAWCSYHHIAWWDRDHGPTNLDNLCLLCNHHHHLIHDAGWTLHRDPNRTWHLTRPNGTRVRHPRYPGPPTRPPAAPAA